MSKKKNVSVGELALIPIGDDNFIPAKVLYLSRFYKDVVLLGLFALKQTGRDLHEALLPSEPSLTVYTSQVPITKGRWKSTGIVQPLNEREKGKAKRIVGGSV